MVAGHRKKATELIGSIDRERENSKEMLKVVTPRKNIVPGNRSYASATKYGKKVLVIGDSHLRNIKRDIFSDSLLECKSYIKCFGGGTVEELSYYVIPSLLKQQPDYVVLHIGSNNISFKDLSANLRKLANDIIDIANVCYQHNVKKVFISSILVKKSIRLSSMINQLNDMLEESCLLTGIGFIKNIDVTRDYLCKTKDDGIHFSYSGACILAGNMVDAINHYNSDNTSWTS